MRGSTKSTERVMTQVSSSRYRWEPVRPDLELFNRRDPLLEQL